MAEKLETVAVIEDEQGNAIGYEDRIVKNVCKICGRDIPVGEEHDVFVVRHGIMVLCDECVGTLAGCDICGHYVMPEEVNTDVSGCDSVCDRCYDERCAECNDCGMVFERDEMYNISDLGVWVCGRCRAHYAECEYCGRTMHEDDLRFYDCVREYRCEDCVPHDRNILDYHSSDRPDLEYIRMSENPEDRYRLVGFEIEVDDGRGEVLDLADALSSSWRDPDTGARRYWMERDGSLSDGLEIITMPCDMAYIRRSDMLIRIADICHDHGFRSHDTSTCGLHLHVDRRAFGESILEQETAITKVIYLSYRFYGMFLELSRRSRSDFENWAERYDLSPGHVSYDDIKSQNGHYKIFNIRSNTVELRMFRGTLKVGSMIAAAEFYFGLIDLCKATDIATLDGMSWGEILSCVISDPDYVDLRRYIGERIPDFTPVDISDIQARIQARADDIEDVKNEGFCRYPGEPYTQPQRPIGGSPLNVGIHGYAELGVLLHPSILIGPYCGVPISLTACGIDLTMYPWISPSPSDRVGNICHVCGIDTDMVGRYNIEKLANMHRIMRVFDECPDVDYIGTVTYDDEVYPHTVHICSRYDRAADYYNAPHITEHGSGWYNAVPAPHTI